MGATMTVGRMNVNDTVWVRLNDRGREIDRAAHEQLRAIAPSLVGPYADRSKNGWSSLQLFQLMSRFGAQCYLGSEPPFDTEISLVDPNI